MPVTIEVVKNNRLAPVCVTSLSPGQTFKTQALGTYGVRTKKGWIVFYTEDIVELNFFKVGDEKEYPGFRGVIPKEFGIKIIITE